MQAYLTEQFVRQANNFSNARLVEPFGKGIRRQALRLSKLTEPTRKSCSPSKRWTWEGREMNLPSGRRYRSR